MTKFTRDSSPIAREVPMLYRGRHVIVELHPTFVRYRLKGKQGYLHQINHGLAIASRDQHPTKEEGDYEDHHRS